MKVCPQISIFSPSLTQISSPAVSTHTGVWYIAFCCGIQDARAKDNKLHGIRTKLKCACCHMEGCRSQVKKEYHVLPFISLLATYRCYRSCGDLSWKSLGHEDTDTGPVFACLAKSQDSFWGSKLWTGESGLTDKNCWHHFRWLQAVGMCHWSGYILVHPVECDQWERAVKQLWKFC